MFCARQSGGGTLSIFMRYGMNFLCVRESPDLVMIRSGKLPINSIHILLHKFSYWIFEYTKIIIAHKLCMIKAGGGSYVVYCRASTSNIQMVMSGHCSLSVCLCTSVYGHSMYTIVWKQQISN